MSVVIKETTPGSLAYPTRLKELPWDKQKLPTLYLLGREDLANSPKALAIIGSRHAHEESLLLAREAGHFFAQSSYTIVTGLARGVDMEATYGALEAGFAIGVVPFGLETSETKRLLRQFSTYLPEKLLLLSEQAPHRPWHARYAMMRNRLVVGLADAVLVVQTGPKIQEKKGRIRHSGTWDAVEKAHQIGRPIFVLDLPIEGNQALKREIKATPIPPSQEGFRHLEALLNTLLTKDPHPPAAVQPRLL